MPFHPLVSGILKNKGIEKKIRRHALSRSFDIFVVIFVVTYRVTNFLPKLIHMLLLSTEKLNFHLLNSLFSGIALVSHSWFPMFWSGRRCLLLLDQNLCLAKWNRWFPLLSECLVVQGEGGILDCLRLDPEVHSMQSQWGYFLDCLNQVQWSSLNSKDLLGVSFRIKWDPPVLSFGKIFPTFSCEQGDKLLTTLGMYGTEGARSVCCCSQCVCLQLVFVLWKEKQEEPIFIDEPSFRSRLLR